MVGRADVCYVDISNVGNNRVIIFRVNVCHSEC